MDRDTTGGLKEPFFSRENGTAEVGNLVGKFLKIFRENTPTGGKIIGPNAEKTEK